MPTSYQAPKRADQQTNRTHSQSSESNLQASQATVAQILSTKGREVFSIKPEDRLSHVVEVLRDKRIGALIVTTAEGALCGIISERDIVRKLAEIPGQTLPQQVKDVMTPDVQTCAPSASLVDVLKTMTKGRFRHMPVIEDGALVGMVTIGDVINNRLTELEHETLQLKQLIVG